MTTEPRAGGARQLYMRKDMVATALMLPAALVLSGCGGSNTEFEAANTTVTYEFIDSSVAPEHHRSFTLNVSDGEGTVVIEAYGDELDRAEAGVDEAAVDGLLQAYADGDLDAAFDPETDDDGCAGGRTFKLRLDDGETVAQTTVYLCQMNEQEAEDLREAVAPLLDAFDIESLTDGRY